MMVADRSMLAARCTRLGGLGGITVESIPVPRPANDQILIKVDAAGVNFADRLMLDGHYQHKPEPPFTLGLELAGTVAQTVGSTGGLEIGDPVIAVVDEGAFANYAVARACDVIRRPASMPAGVGAAIAINYGTAHGALAWKAGLRSGETVLVHGAAGGTGLAAVGCAKAMGARVIATARGTERAAIACKHGADIALSSTRPDLIEAIKSAADPQTGNGRVDVVFDTVGGDLFAPTIRCLASDGRFLVIGFASGKIPQAPANIFLVKNADMMGFHWGHYRRANNQRWREGLEWVLDSWQSSKINPVIHQMVPLQDINHALGLLKSREATGKVILAIE